MAVKKTASPTKPKAKDAPAPAPKTVEPKGAGAAKTETAPPKTTAAPKSAAAAAAPKKAAPKKAAAPAVKLTSTQTDLLGRVHGSGEPGFRSAKKGEQRTLDALRERKLIKRGSKDKESGDFHYQVSNAGKKHIETNPTAPAAPTGAGTPSTPPASGGSA